MERYGIIFPKHPILRRLIKFYWWAKADTSINISQPLLPTLSNDIILNFGTPLHYNTGSSIITPDRIHFSGIRNTPIILQHKGVQDIIGISFYPAGIYSLLQIPLSDFKFQHGFSLPDILRRKAALFDEVYETNSTAERVDKIEEILLKLIDPEPIYESNIIKIVDTIYDTPFYDTKLYNFCDKMGISRKTLERLFSKMIGVSPKMFFNHMRFQEIYLRLKFSDYDSLTNLAYDYSYFDQAHLNKDFKKFAGITPSQLEEGEQIYVQIPDTQRDSMKMFDFMKK